MNPRVTNVQSKENYTLLLTFDNSEQRVFDVKPFLEKGIFRELKDENKFKQVKPFLGSIQWQGGQDFCADTLYENAISLAHLEETLGDY